MKLLQVLPSIDPKMGGTAEVVLQLGLHLGKNGCRVDVATLDDPTRSFVTEYPLNVIALGPSHGTYSYSNKFVPWLKTNAGHYDAVIVNGLWQYHSVAVWRALRKLGVPYYVFPHGMLDPWFKRTYPLKHLKKWMYWPWAEYRVLRDARSVLFTSEEERLLARQSFWLYSAKEEMVVLGTSPPPDNVAELKAKFLGAHSKLDGLRIILFMGRIHEKKACDLLVESFAAVAADDPALHLLMAGPSQIELLVTLKNLARRLNIMERISWPGMLRGDIKWGAFYSAEVFVLPSHQENFGIAVAEAMSCGLPVLISDKVNIWREVEADGAGFVAADTREGTEKSLSKWLHLDSQHRTEMARRAVLSYQKRFTVAASAALLLNVLQREEATPRNTAKPFYQ